MQTHQEFFGCRYPILAVAMNQVSDVDLAIAVTQAGGFASISLFNYYKFKGVIDWEKVNVEFQRYQDTIGNCRFVLSIDTTFLIDDQPRVVDLVRKFNISHIELIAVEEHRQNPTILAKIHQWLSALQDMGTRIILKTVVLPEDPERWAQWDNGSRSVDAFGLKGPAAAGRVMETDQTLEQLIAWCQQHYPSIPVIAVGGVGNNVDAVRIMNLGVMAIGVGTLFAAAEESPVARETKLKMISATAQDLTKLNTDHLKQNSLKLGEFNQQDNDNNTMSLRAGIKSGTQGHIFAGHGINSVTEILPVNTIVQQLFKDFEY